MSHPSSTEVAQDVFYVTNMMVNVCFLRDSTRQNDWVLVDAGLQNAVDPIRQFSKAQLGKEIAPKAIVLTHGHFDHVGALPELLKNWHVPVYAHEAELPYLTGESDYPPPDPSVGGGLLASVSSVYPHHGINLGEQVQPLPADGSVPYLSGWRWIHTPGHTPGHVSLFRDQDRVLIAGDAFTTVKQESAWAVLTQDKEVHGPPSYFTIDWVSARESVKKLEALHPRVVVTGHGQPLQGESLRTQLDALADDFAHLAVPPQGQYVPEQWKR
ncbi:MBL fold metallo-hydrolase [Heliobacillus mobilis]|uniref:MBL fold metallo-hydrolase n=1 Tax=Heliobacterium mobile TaxID=28064 RepID=A0A6I3SJI7_HELMO|nr:MBL fold metallo-hydrolase [Heliobacterium mobile]MTV48767.1 MBL fold metallo-hydrolase [Heliobacterium mobile]